MSSLANPYSFWRCVGENLAKSIRPYVTASMTSGKNYPQWIVISNESLREIYDLACTVCGNLQDKPEYIIVFDYDRQSCRFFDVWVEYMSRRFSRYRYNGESLKVKYRKFQSYTAGYICTIDIKYVHSEKELYVIADMITDAFIDAWKKYVMSKLSAPAGAEAVREKGVFGRSPLISDYITLIDFLQDMYNDADEVTKNSEMASTIYEELIYKYKNILGTVKSEQVMIVLNAIENSILSSVESFYKSAEYIRELFLTIPELKNPGILSNIRERAVKMGLIEILDVINTIEIELGGE